MLVFTDFLQQIISNQKARLENTSIYAYFSKKLYPVKLQHARGSATKRQPTGGPTIRSAKSDYFIEYEQTDHE